MTTLFVPIKPSSRTGPYGRLIQCPHCGHIERVYHFAWSAATCQGCHEMVGKYDFSMEKK